MSKYQVKGVAHIERDTLSREQDLTPTKEIIQLEEEMRQTIHKPSGPVPVIMKNPKTSCKR